MLSRCDSKAAKRFFGKLLKKLGFASRVIVTDKLKSYGATKKEILKGVEHSYSQEFKQSSGKLASTKPIKREANASVKFPCSGAAISLDI